MVQNWVVVVVVGAKTVKNSVEAVIRAEIEKNSLSLSFSRRVIGGIFNAELLRNFVRAINNIRATKAGKTRFKIVDFSGGEAAPVVPRRGFAEYAFSPPRNLVRLLYP